LGIDEEYGQVRRYPRAVIGDLRFDPDIGVSDVRVEEMDGDVVLTGSVTSYQQAV
jgi:hypothetical protein